MINEKRINFMNLERLDKRKKDAKVTNQLIKKNLSCADVK